MKKVKDQTQLPGVLSLLLILTRWPLGYLLVVLLLLLLDQLNLLLGSQLLVRMLGDIVKEILAKRALFWQLVVPILIANWL